MDDQPEDDSRRNEALKMLESLDLSAITLDDLKNLQNPALRSILLGLTGDATAPGAAFVAHNSHHQHPSHTRHGAHTSHTRHLLTAPE